MFSEVGSGHFVAASGEPVEMHDITHTPAQPPQLPSTSAGQPHVLHGLGIAIEADVERLFLETHTFLDQYRLLFNDYNGANRSFVCVDAGLSVLVGMVGGLRAVVPNCIGLSCVVLLLFVVFLVTVVLRRPYNSSFLYWFTVVMTGGQAANALLTVVYVIGNEGDGGVSVALDVVTWISTVLAYLLLFRTATDAIPKGYIFYRKMRALVRGRVDAHGELEVKAIMPMMHVDHLSDRSVPLALGGSLQGSFAASFGSERHAFAAIGECEATQPMIGNASRTSDIYSDSVMTAEIVAPALNMSFGEPIEKHMSHAQVSEQEVVFELPVDRSTPLPLPVPLKEDESLDMIPQYSSDGLRLDMDDEVREATQQRIQLLDSENLHG
ncbi:transmembrane protein, putative [Bodo saltans]|uniref:Transmembrane protein, putative n=1 Tax=Bodo saltans TaxID=75058 RepID=A0A0S4J5N6_BODSA|nr:transmembrane protein, putative [Bodo saltans]|eukprot:CUG86736.1 transmembrane protein, putative [Bodo saltans]